MRGRECGAESSPCPLPPFPLLHSAKLGREGRAERVRVCNVNPAECGGYREEEAVVNFIDTHGVKINEHNLFGRKR